MFKLTRFLKDYRKELILGPFFKLLEALFELIVPLVMAKIIDNGITSGDRGYILRMSGVIVLLGVCGLGFALTCQYFAARCGMGFGTDLRKALYKHINTLSHAEIDKIGTSSLITRLINDTTSAQTGVNMFIRLAVRVPFLIIGATVMAMILDLKLSIVFLIAGPIIAIVLYFVMSKSVPMYKTIQKKLDRVSRITKENLDGVRVIRAFSRQNEEIDKFNDASQDVASHAIAVGRLSTILNPATFMVMNLAIVGILWFGGIRVDQGDLTQGQIIAFVNYLTQILLALIMMAHLVIIFTKAEASGNRINEIFEMHSELVDGEKNIDINVTAPAIEFKNVSFAYADESEPAVHDISFILQKGETLGIIGGTGSGKSTVVNLISRFYDVNNGEVRLFGENIKEYKLNSLRQAVGVVPQKASLFTGTVLDNLKWGKENATEQEAKYALDIAQAWGFVSKMPNGINSHISQGGKNLSGGQRQRLTIARSIIGKPPILILDDSMSALDYATDYALRNAITKKLSDTTLVIISQRATSLKNADKIMVLDDGEMVGLGTHEQLYNSCDIYREICDTQGGQEE